MYNEFRKVVFDEVAVQAVKNYQATVATEDNAESNEKGDTNNVERGKESESSERFHGGRESVHLETQDGTGTSDENRSEIQRGAGNENEESVRDRTLRLK